MALEYLLETGLTGEPTIIRGDSNLVIQQMAGRWSIGRGAYVDLAFYARQLLSQFELLPQLVWIPREQNGEADGLSKTGGIRHINGRTC